LLGSQARKGPFNLEIGMKSNRWVFVASLTALLAGSALAQGGPGGGMGPGAGMQGAGPMASAPGTGPGMGMGMGPGKGMGRGAGAVAGAGFTPGWALMTPAERTEHRSRMLAMKSYQECTAYRKQQHELMAARAKERGGKPLLAPRRDACAGLKQ
jgi:hypothetical protein